MYLAAYRQHNPPIPPTAELCRTGRLKRGYGVEPMLRLLSDNLRYRETHNALFDAMDELEFLRLVGEIVNVSADEAVLGENGKVDVKKLQPITYAPMNHNYKVPGEKV